MTGDEGRMTELSERPTNPAQTPPSLSTFWLGPRLPDFQNLCLRSWMAQGHRVQFFSYEPVENVPDGVVLRDAADVTPYRRLFGPDRQTHIVIRSDLWRLAMFQKDEGVWCDSDVVLLRPIPRPQRFLLAPEHDGKPCVAVMWWPSDHPAVAEILDVFDRKALGPWAYAKPRWKRFLKALSGKAGDFSDYPWNHWGRHAVQYYIQKHSLQADLLSYKSFYWPVVYDAYLFEENPFEHIIDDPEVLGLHCFFKPADAFRDAPPGSFMHWAKARFGG